jgi:hypothetical protein
MHRYVVSDAVKERRLRRQGKLVSHDTIDAGRTALVVVDMQNHFVAEGFAIRERPAADNAASAALVIQRFGPVFVGLRMRAALVDLDGCKATLGDA